MIVEQVYKVILKVVNLFHTVLKLQCYFSAYPQYILFIYKGQ